MTNDAETTRNLRKAIDLQPARDVMSSPGDRLPGDPFAIRLTRSEQDDLLAAERNLRIMSRLCGEWESRAEEAEAENRKMKERAFFFRSLLTPEDTDAPEYWSAFLGAILEPALDPQDTLYKYVRLLVGVEKIRQCVLPLIMVAEYCHPCAGTGVGIKDCNPDSFALIHTDALRRLETLRAFERGGLLELESVVTEGRL